MRLAVLSDLHVWRDVEPESWSLATRAFDTAVEAAPDHVVIAGDLFDYATVFEEDAAAVRGELRRRGLWNRRKLSVVVGNHDIFETPHHGGIRKWITAAKTVLCDAQGSYEAFCSWAEDLVDSGGRLSSGDLFPFAKRIGHVLLLASDTTGRDTARSVNGYWHREDDAALRTAEADGLRRVLAIHHPPEEAEERYLPAGQLNDPSFGFPPGDHRRLVRFADDVKLDAVVCGHIHWNGGEPWSWRVGKRARAFMMGRTGGLACSPPSIGILEVPRRGPPTWKVRRVR